MRHFYRLSEFSSEEIGRFLDKAVEFKKDPYRSRCLERRQIGLLFLNPSLRTRCSFEVGIRQLGGGVSTLEAQSLWKLESEMGVRMDGERSEHVKEAVGVRAWRNFTFIEGDIRQRADCRRASADVEFVLHHAALGSVPRSVEDPVAAHDVNLTGFVNTLVAARDAGVARFIYAASSSTYGDHPGLPKVEEAIGRPLSLSSRSSTIRSCSGYGSGLSKTASTTLKMAVFAPIPRARVSTATRVKAGCLRSWRSP